MDDGSQLTSNLTCGVSSTFGFSTPPQVSEVNT